ncbi:MAG TPA: zinc ribbon domain-containing protein [Aridibacter sp.]|nr:zinc ribbon domain-containing protein [Aridibacter sp.]
MEIRTIYCPKCGIGNSTEVRYCRSCGVELDTVAALIEGRLVISGSGEEEGFFRRPSWEKALVSFSLGVALLIASFVFGFDPENDSTTPWLALLFAAFPIIGYGIAQIIKVSNKDKESRNVTVRTVQTAPGRESKELPESQTEYVSPEADPKFRTADHMPSSVVEGTTRHLEMEESAVTNDLSDQDAKHG